MLSKQHLLGVRHQDKRSSAAAAQMGRCRTSGSARVLPARYAAILLYVEPTRKVNQKYFINMVHGPAQALNPGPRILCTNLLASY